MSLQNILGVQTQVGGDVFASLVRATWPASIKLVSCMPLPLVAEWRAHRPDGLLVYRKWYADGDGSVAEAERRSRETIDEARPLLAHGPVLLEAPWNEERANGDGLDSLADQTVVFADLAAEAGFVPLVFVEPEGNPADKADLRRAKVIAALRRIVARCGFVVIAAHGYSAPPLAPDDPWHFAMWEFWLAAIEAEAPEILDHVLFYLGELGTDGGVQTGRGPNRPETGYRGYGSVAQYATGVLRVQHARMLTSPHVLGGAVFGSEMLAPWNSDHGFDIRDEVDVRPAFTERFDAPARLAWSWPPKQQEVPPVPDQPTLTTMAMWRQGSDLQPACRTPEGLAAALNAGGFAVAVADVLQGTTPQRTFSGTQVDVGSPAEAAALAMDLMGHGVRFWPMQNVLGADTPAEVAALKAHADAIRAATGESTVVLDLEALYPGFFNPHDDLASAIRAHVAEVDRVFTPGLWTVILCPDPRQIGREYPLDLIPAHWVLMPQTYDKDFGQTWRACYRRYLPAATTDDLADAGDPTPAAAAGYGGRTVIPMLQGDDPTLTLRDEWQWLARHHRWACVWGFGSLVGQHAPGLLDDYTVARAVAGPYEALPVTVPVAPPAPPDPASPAVRALIEAWWQDTLRVAADGNEAGAVALQAGVAAAKVALGLQPAA